MNSVAKSGGTITQLGSGQSKPFRLVLDADFVYWTDELGASVMRAPKDGSTKPQLISVASQPGAIALDATNVYWVNLGDMTLRTAPKTGGTGTTVVALPSDTELFGDGQSLYANVFYSGQGLDFWSIIRIDPSTGQQTQITSASGLAWFGPIAMSGNYLFAQSNLEFDWFDKTSGTFQGNVWAPEISSGMRATTMVADSCAMYWIGGTPGDVGPNFVSGIAMLPMASQGIVPLIATSGAKRLAVDGAAVYWTDDTAIGRLALP